MASSSVSPAKLINAVENAFVSAGYFGINVSAHGESPAKFLLTGQVVGSIPVWVYIKNLSFAKRADKDEFRIQLPSDILPLILNPDGPTLLLGYHADEKIFVGFDPLAISTGARTQISGGYVSLRVAKLAKKNGLSFDRDRRDRIAVGIRADMLVTYALLADEIHDAASDDAALLKTLTKAAEGYTSLVPRSHSDIPISSSPQRQLLIKRVRVLSRDAGFRSRVLAAYGKCCAVTGVQLGLVDAAHILPVNADGSNDSVQNGLCLLPHYHRAYDAGLIFLDTKYEMRINQRRAGNLGYEGLDLGLEEFSKPLGKIRLPANKRDWPDLSFIERANCERGL